MAREKLFGISEKGWKAIDVASVGLILATTVADFAQKSKNRKIKKFSRVRPFSKGIQTNEVPIQRTSNLRSSKKPSRYNGGIQYPSQEGRYIPRPWPTY